MSEWRDQEFLSPAAQARRTDAPWAGHALLAVVGLLFVTFIVWASLAELDEVTRAEGRVIPTGQARVVQSLEPGILSELLVKEGDLVEAGQVLLRIDDTQSRASFQENAVARGALSAKIARLRAEAEGAKSFQPPPEITEKMPDVAAGEARLFATRQNALKAVLESRRQKVEQRRQEMAELRATLSRLEASLKLAREELDITAPLVKKGVMSQVELIRLKREVSDLDGERKATTHAISRLEAALAESRSGVEEAILNFRAQARAELADALGERAQIQESVSALQDRVTRAELRSPVRGVVLRIAVNTIGQVTPSGADLVEITPLEESLLVEARVNPKDIGFLRPGLPAMVKFSAYDYAIYGGLQGELTRISADSITSADGERYYQIQARTERTALGSDSAPLAIIPGMAATVELVTGRKSVLDYLLKPILRARNVALRER
ncbi:HlyD family type I secretion periplasmic adaptor subunit [Magnetofaba australis]|uniref:Membrane fusion protein (MFP) family protein n=1 Tax=Magnetofaba australis IT-1 TaxID=1434232 RepID=A0A1Y2K1D7_9PROT|nr:HlyD family type I secretion periplasmic adaptor subunit [Magnetofaba australis]OSM01823.1 putative HlyD family type I secretion membrane fusion protein [Magnetofaba australis IT-1]